MKITQEVRDYAAQQGMSEEVVLEEGLRAKAQEFKERGAEIYIGT
jgi:phosphomethylpyrimidine synthase